MKKQIEWIILTTKNYLIAKEFYSKKLNLKIIRNVPKEEFTQFKMDNCYLAIYGEGFVKKLLNKTRLGEPGNTIFTFSQSEDIDADFQKLLLQGVKFIQPPKTQTWGQRTAYFEDPDGHIWEIQQWISK